MQITKNHSEYLHEARTSGIPQALLLEWPFLMLQKSSLIAKIVHHKRNWMSYCCCRMPISHRGFWTSWCLFTIMWRWLVSQVSLFRFFSLEGRVLRLGPFLPFLFIGCDWRGVGILNIWTQTTIYYRCFLNFLEKQDKRILLFQTWNRQDLNKELMKVQL